jgi:DNA modification methylase
LTNRIAHLLIQADARRIPLADRSVHCVVTSPPYWGLRDYGVGGQIGLEATPDAFVAEIVRVFREVRRVLRDDGTLWMNLGDSYASTGEFGRNDGGGPGRLLGEVQAERSSRRLKNDHGLKPKDLIGIPWRVALALQADGWYLRSDIIWAKPNPMPESVTDRPTKSHEYLFLMAKSERYYFDAEAVREPGTRYEWNSQKFKGGDLTRHHGSTRGKETADPEAGRNLRTVWPIATEAYPGSHFATFPRKLVEPCIKAGTSEKGVCPTCGAPWERVVESERIRTRPGLDSKCYDRSTGEELAANDKPWASERVGNRDPGRHISVKSTTGWAAGCECGRGPIPATVLDPFAGSGTTLVVANALGRRAVGLDLSREYLGLAANRITRPHAMIPRAGRDESFPLFEAAPC